MKKTLLLTSILLAIFLSSCSASIEGEWKKTHKKYKNEAKEKVNSSRKLVFMKDGLFKEVNDSGDLKERGDWKIEGGILEISKLDGETLRYKVVEIKAKLMILSHLKWDKKFYFKRIE